ncbi:MAG: gamma-glutamylcyclotransferase [Arenimonas sp.]|nr:gamma-glutamylcyclotransferase [Rhizobium sp.]MBW8445028.1 gamma-glutamylcyclotransferase [Arenimonas sp.]
MWVFGYGSLMWDNWQRTHGGTDGVLAELKGYQRSFNKASRVNWGTDATPGPTLNLVVKADGACVGYAFEFDDSKQAEVFADLERREGKNFPLRKMRITLSDGRNVEAHLPVYVGRNVITGKTLDELVAMAMAAVGRAGKASDYVLNVAGKLNAVGVEDATVIAFAAAIRNAQQSGG